MSHEIERGEIEAIHLCVLEWRGWPGAHLVVPKLSGYEFARRIPDIVEAPQAEAMALCALPEDLQALLFSNDPALLERLLPEHRQAALDSIWGSIAGEQSLAAHPEPGETGRAG